jgi:nucleotide sugar dehydrogenase
MRVAVVGGGRMGLPLACVFAKRGAFVTVCDLDPAVVHSIGTGVSPFEEPGLDELVAELHAAGRLYATADTARASSAAEVVVVIVPAHLTAQREIDFTTLEAASTDVGSGLRSDSLVIYETTLAVGGTRRRLVPVLERHSGMQAGVHFHVAYSPERVKANLVLERLETTSKVVGGFDEASCARAVDFYRTYLGAPIDDVGTLEAAELTKLIGMLYRDVNIALANELAAYAEVVSVDFDRARAAANKDGEAHLLAPGIGVGGHCTPVYPYFLTRQSRRLGVAQRISEAARDINEQQPARQLERLAAAWKPLLQQTVHILGLAFRPGVKVHSMSPAFALRDHLTRKGASVTIEDPCYSDAELRALRFCPGSVHGSHAVVLNTAHGQFAEPDFAAWRRFGVEAVLDGRNLWKRSAVESAGILYLGVGRASRSAAMAENHASQALYSADCNAIAT